MPSFEVETKETVYRRYIVTADDPGDADEKVRQGEADDFTQIDAEIDEIVSIDEMED